MMTIKLVVCIYGYVEFPNKLNSSHNAFTSGLNVQLACFEVVVCWLMLFVGRWVTNSRRELQTSVQYGFMKHDERYTWDWLTTCVFVYITAVADVADDTTVHGDAGFLISSLKPVNGTEAWYDELADSESPVGLRNWNVNLNELESGLLRMSLILWKKPSRIPWTGQVHYKAEQRDLALPWNVGTTGVICSKI